MEGRTQYYQVADLFIDAKHERVWRDGCEIRLGKLTFDLLITLVHAAPELVSVDTLISVVWVGTVVGPETVSQRVKRLRVALGDDPKAPRYVGGVRGRGYRLVATVKSKPAMETVPPLSRHTLHWRAALAGAMALLLLSAGSYSWVHLRRQREPQPAAARTLGRHTGASAAQLYRQAGSVVLSEPGLRQAMLLLDGAIAQQPDFAPAFVARAQVRVGIGLLGYAPPDVLEGAERDAHRALALQPGLNTANAVLGITNSYRGNWLDAEAQFHTALAAADPGAAVRAEYATFCLGSAGHLQQALQELNRAYRLAPSSQSTVVLLAAMNALAGHEDAAYRLAVLARDLGYPQNSPPLVQILAGSAQRRGDFTQAARLAQDSLSPAIRSAGGAETLNIVYAALADPARRPAAHAALEHLLRSVDQLDLDIVTRVEIIEWLTQTDALDSAYALADATIDQFARSGAVGNTWGFLWGEEMRPFRRDARFQGLVQRLKLVSEWQRNGAPDNCSLKERQLNCV